MPISLTDAVQDFNDLTGTTSTTDQLPSGSQLTNTASFNTGGPGLDFVSFWIDTRGVGAGPSVGAESGDFIGVNSFSGSNAPDNAADGTAVGTSERNFQFNDTDGRIDLIFETVDASGFSSRQLAFNYWINDTGYEADDSFSAALSDGTTTVSLLTLGEPELEAQASADGLNTPWQSFTVDLDALIAANSLDETALSLVISTDTNAGVENIFVDDIAFTGTAGPSVPAIAINEIRIDQPGTDNDEYFELTGDTGTSLDGLTYLVIGDGAGGSGVIENVTALDGFSIPADGFFLAAESTFTLSTGVDLTTTLNFENGDNVTHLLVQGFTGSNQQDLDTDDDGILDVTPWDTILDSVALIETPGSGDRVYSPTQVGPDGGFVPAHVFRDPDATGAFQIGNFNPADGGDTPGATNVPAPVQPLVINEMIVSTASIDQEFFELLGEPGRSLDGFALLEVESGGEIDTVIDLTGFALGDNGYFLGASPEAEADLGVTGNLQIANNTFTNNSQTYLLVEGFTGASGTDIDANDDGAIDVTPWTAITDSVAFIEAGSPITYSPNVVGPDGSFLAPGGFRNPEGTGPFQIHAFGDSSGYTPTAGTGDVGDPEPVLISEIQGSGAQSTRVGEAVLVEAIVTSVNNGQSGDLGGFFIQEEDTDQDGLDTTSEGLFVFSNSSVTAGDLVRVTGTVAEFEGETQLSGAAVEIVSSGNTLPTATPIDLPTAGTVTNRLGDLIPDLEAVEGMLVTFPEELTVTELFNLDRFGEFRLSEGGRLFQFTNDNAPSVAGFAAHLEDIASRTITVDDGFRNQNPDPVPYPDGSLDTADSFRMGDTVTGLTGVVSFKEASNELGNTSSSNADTYRIIPTLDPVFETGNPRPEEPEDVGGSLQVASFNVLNFFTTIDDGATLTDVGLEPRGADDLSRFDETIGRFDEFDRQLEKLTTAIIDLDADIIGLIELENDFNFDGDAAIEVLVENLNAALAQDLFAFVDPGINTIGTDAIAQGFIYRQDKVQIADGTTVEFLSDADLPGLGLDFGGETVFDGIATNRNPLAVTFEEIDTGGEVTVVVNHFKSKGSSGLDDPSDPLFDPESPNFDQLDGQGFWNVRRTQASEALDAWLGTDPTGSGDEDFLIIGDLNAYPQEDPITTLEESYDNLFDTFGIAQPYSFVFDGQAGALDYALSSSSLTSQVTGITEWHINADEADAIDYNLDFGRPGDIFDGTVPFRASDHDPVIVGLNLTAPEPAQDLELVRINDWFNEQTGRGGYNATYTLTLTEDDVEDGTVKAWELDVDVEDGSFNTGWTQGFNAPVSFDPSTGTFSTVDQGFQQELEVGDTITFAIQVLGAGFDEEGVTVSFDDLDDDPVLPDAGDPAGLEFTQLSLNDWGMGLVQQVGIRNIGDETVDGWIVKLDLDAGELDNLDLQNVWSAQAVEFDGNIFFFPQTYNESLDPGESTNFGFQANILDNAGADFDADDFSFIGVDDLPLGLPVPDSFEFV